MRSLQTKTDDTDLKIAEAIDHLRQARDLFKESGCPQTVKRIRLALTSAGGAQRHAGRRPTGK